MSIDWEPIVQFVNEAPILVDGLCQNCLQYPFEYDGGYVCAQCGTKWSPPMYRGEVYSSWCDKDAEGIPVKDKKRRGLGIYS